MCLCFCYECRSFFNFNLHGVTRVVFTSDNELMFHSGSNQNLHHDVVIILHHDVVIRYVIVGDCTQFGTLYHKFLMLYLLSLLLLTHCLHELNQHFWPFSNSILFYFQLITFFNRKKVKQEIPKRNPCVGKHNLQVSLLSNPTLLFPAVLLSIDRSL